KKLEQPRNKKLLAGETWIVEQVREGSAPTREDVIVLNDFRRGTKPLDIAESDFWIPCVRAFVLAQPDVARRVLTEMFAHYTTACDADGRVVLAKPLGRDGRARPSQSDLTFAGTLAANRIDLSLRLTQCDASPDADRVAIIADGERWTSPRVEV